VNRRGGDGKTPLHYASDPAVIAWLLEHGAALETRDLDHQGTALQWMIAEQKYAAARELLKRGAQVDIFAAVVLGEPDWVKAALEAHPHAIRARVNHGGYELTPIADGGHEYVYAFSGAGMSPHQLALRYGQAEIFAYLVEHSPPDIQLLAQCAAGNREAAKRIVDAQPDLVAGLSNADQRQLLQAAGDGQVDIVRLMIELGFDLQNRDDDAMTALHWAAFHGHADVIAALLAADDEPPLYELNAYGGAPLTTCLYGSRHSWRDDGDHAASLKLLVAAGSEVKLEWLPTGDDEFDQILRSGLDRENRGQS
jgi:ankyrin repeat protein